MRPSLEELTQFTAAATGSRWGTLLLKNARVVSVLTHEIILTDILLAGRYIAALGAGYRAEQEVDVGGRWVMPGLIDGHLHLESSLVEPREYARAVVPRGVTAVVADPHEIANVCGLDGIRYMIEATEALPLDVFFTASSCVPSTGLETAGARISVAEIASLLEHPRVVGVAELMNFPGIVQGDPAELQKMVAAELSRKVADGHAPLLTGRGLQAYLGAGVQSDHECSTLQEATERLRSGATLMIRESSGARNLDALFPAITPATWDRICLVTDDRHPHDLMGQGGVDHLVRRLIAKGIDPAIAIRLGSYNTARYFGLRRRGAVAPGYIADLVILDDLTALRAGAVYRHGALVAQDGSLLTEPARHADARVLDTVTLPHLTLESFHIPAPVGPVRVIGLIPGEIVTRAETAASKVRDGLLVADPVRDLAKLAVIERHGKNGNVGLGLIRGFGLKQGAIASTVAHDSHNLIIAGVSDADMLLAATCVGQMGGGFCAVANGAVLAKVPLPIAGLMSPETLERVQEQLESLEMAARGLGVTHPAPFMALSFVALPVIPALKLTDRGLVETRNDSLVLVDLAADTALISQEGS